MSRSIEIATPAEVEMFGFGGTWAMETIDGVRTGKGVLGDEDIFRLERDIGIIDFIRYGSQHNPSYSNILNCEKRLAHAVWHVINCVEPIDAAKQLESWCPEFGLYAQGPLFNVFNGDSVHYRTAVAAPLTAFLLAKKLARPRIVKLAGRGTDTADREFTPQVDVQSFDTELAPDIASGSNNPYSQPGSDARPNFRDMARISQMHLDPGSYWAFHRYIYSVADLEKFNPNESRPIEGRSTFMDPQATAFPIEAFLKLGKKADYSQAKAPGPEHPIYKVNWESLFDAMSAVYTLDLGNQNMVWDEVEQILNPRNKAIIIAGHGTGAANDVIREACVEASRRGSLVFVASRALIGIVEGNYETSLLGAGGVRDMSEESFRFDPTRDAFLSAPAEMINGGKLSKSPLRALATRAILEGLEAEATQDLVNRYAKARSMAS